MQTPKLNTRNRRIDVSLDNQSTTLFISNGISRRSIHYSPQAWSEACDAEQMVVVELDQDDGIVARVVLGKLNKQEKDEWIERGVRVLDLSDGEIVLCGGCTFVSADSSEEDLTNEQDYYQPIGVRPGRYLVTVYTQATFINGFRLTRSKDWPGFLNYFRQTRPKKAFPGWLVEFATLAGEETDVLDETQIDDDESDELVQFVVHLEPVDDAVSLTDLAEGYLLDGESRLPAKCPLGIAPAYLLPDQDTEVAKDPSNKGFPVDSSDPEVLTTLFRPFAKALFDRQIDEASSYFAASIQVIAAQYMDPKRNRRTWNPLNDVWLEKQMAEYIVDSWRELRDQLDCFFSLDLIHPETYLGTLNFEFGNPDDFESGKSRRYKVVRAIVITTDDGPKLAAIYIMA